MPAQLADANACGVPGSMAEIMAEIWGCYECKKRGDGISLRESEKGIGEVVKLR